MNRNSNTTTPNRPSSLKIAPTAGSGKTPGPLSPGGLGIDGGFTFTARTCVELLPKLSKSQLDREIKQLLALDSTVHEKLTMPQTRSSNSKPELTSSRKRDILREYLTGTLSNEVDKIVDKLDLLAESVNRSLEKAEKKLEDTTEHLKEIVETQRETAARLEPNSSINPHTEPIPDGNEAVEKPVRVSSDFDFSGISYDTAVQSFTFDQSLPGNRTCCYFGAVGYSYGSIKHEPAAYPDPHNVLDTIFTEISKHDSTFNRENFSCLVTHYRDGKSSISMHSDDEKNIVPGSNIYTVSFGSTRTLRCYNTIGSLQEQNHTLNHGSVSIMSQTSQAIWKHGILPDPNVTSGRISLTFRHMTNPADSQPQLPEQQQHVPHIQQPCRPARVLLLTDSIHSNTPEHIFESVPGHICIKKKEYQLTNIDKYSQEFGYSDQVIVSMGVNDMARYGHNARSLARVAAPLFHRYNRQYPHCKFVFNSVLKTRDHGWLNQEIEAFNKFMFNLSRDVHNLSFFDSDRFTVRVCRESPHTDVYARGPTRGLSERSMRNEQSNNGIHLSSHMRRLISSELVRSVGFLAGAGGPRFRMCDWLRNVGPRSS